METPLTIENNGEELHTTNFWQHPLNTDHQFFLSWNKGVGRLLIPDSYKNDIQTMASAATVMGQITRHGDNKSLQLLFDDHSNQPYVVPISSQQTDRALPDTALSTILTGWFHNKKRFTLKLKILQDANLH